MHSLDSTHMMMTSLVCDKYDMDFATVHDSYWTHACRRFHVGVKSRRCGYNESVAARAVREALFAAHLGEFLGVAGHSVSQLDVPAHSREGRFGFEMCSGESVLFQLIVSLLRCLLSQNLRCGIWSGAVFKEC